jgi:hypothetical protein
VWHNPLSGVSAERCSASAEAAMSAITPTEISFRQILIATDLSDASANALNYAKAIAKRYASHLVLVHVCRPVRHLAIREGGWVEDLITQRRFTHSEPSFGKRATRLKRSPHMARSSRRFCRSPKLTVLTSLSWEPTGREGWSVCCLARTLKP